MIKFFRRIRQNLLAGYLSGRQSGKFTKYLLYAMGEIFLVVIGILIALQINNWNENRKEEFIRKDLLLSLSKDFMYLNNRVKKEIANSDTLRLIMERFAIDIYSANPSLDIDSLKVLAQSFFRGSAFHPTIPVYDEARSTGTIRLLKSTEFVEEVSALQSSIVSYKGLKDNMVNNFFDGAALAFRQEFGFLSTIRSSSRDVLRDQSEKPMSFLEYVAIFRTTKAKAALENQIILNGNVRYWLGAIEDHSAKLIRILDEML